VTQGRPSQPEEEQGNMADRIHQEIEFTADPQHISAALIDSAQ